MYFSQYNPPCEILKQKWINNSIFQYRKKPIDNVGVMQVRDQQGSWVGGRESGNDGTSSHLTTSDTNDGFFERPVKIASFEWSVGEQLFTNLNPWALFCSDPRIGNRLAHFRNLKMDLHVQLLVNGNPFYHGLGIMFYTPLPSIDDYSQVNDNSVAALVEGSQRPHIYFSPTKSEGGELVLPFIFPKAALDITLAEWGRMGIITIRGMNVLQHVNESTDSLTITVMAYASNVELNTPTSRVPPNLQPQGADEYGSISFPAHLVARAAGVLGDAPVIGRFARATEMIANAIGGVASLFGFSSPRAVPEQLALVRHFGETATTNFPDTSMSLAVDAKKEITIDPRVVGLAPHDEMDFISIVTRESLIARFGWEEADATATHLFTQDVCPVSGLASALGNEYHIAPMAFIALPFEYWKGSIEFRLQVVCSAYHRGRLRVVWDPDYVEKPDNFNVNYSTMLDITESTEITLKIGWGQEYDYLRVPDLATQIDGNPALSPRNAKNVYSNGVLAIYVVNPLTSPGGYSTNVQLNLFARACEDFEVCGPSELNIAPYIPNNLNTGDGPSQGPVGVGGPGGTPTTGSTSGYTPVQVPPTAPPPPSLQPAKTITVAGHQGVYNDDAVEPVRGNTVSAWNGLFVPVSTTPHSGYLYMYSDTTKVFTSNMRFGRYGTGSTPTSITVTVGGGAEQTFAIPVGSNQVDFPINMPLVPGWNTIPFTVKGVGNQGTLRQFTRSVPQDALQYTLGQTQMIGLSNGSAVAYSSGGVNTVRPTASAADMTITLPQWYPGTPVLIESMGETVIPGAQPQLGPVYAADNLNLQTIIPASNSITIGGTGLYQIRGISYLVKGDTLPQGQVEELNLESDEHLRPEAGAPDVTMGPSSDVRGLNDIYFGERITSIRQILKRFTTCYLVDMPDGTSPNTYAYVLLPHYPTLAAPAGNNSAKMTALNNAFAYFSSAFVCMRGGMRIKLFPSRAPNGSGAVWNAIMTRLSTERDYEVSITSGFSESTGQRARLLRFSGSACDTLANKPYLEWELPYYSNYRFTSGRCRRNNVRSFDIVKSTYMYEPLERTVNHIVSANYGIAEDFSLSFFLSTPVLTKSSTF